MIYPVKVVVVLVQVGSNLWINPSQVIALRVPDPGTHPGARMCIVSGVYPCGESDWPLAKVKAVIEKGK